MELDSRGHEVHEGIPVAIPLGFQRPPTLEETIKRLVRGELSRQAADTGQETFEEADDFDVGDDYDPRSPWELSADNEQAELPLAVNGENPEKSEVKRENPDNTGKPLE